MTSVPFSPQESDSHTSKTGVSSSKWGQVRTAVQVAQITNTNTKKRQLTQADTLAVGSNASSASAAFVRSLVLFTGFLFRRPSKLFRPSRVDTWAGLRQLAQQTNQTFSATFIRSLLKRKSGIVAITLTLLPPLIINTTLGFLLFTSHTLFSLGLAKLSFFQLPKDEDEAIVAQNSSGGNGAHDLQRATTSTTQKQEDQGEFLNTLETLIRGPSIVPNHPTILSFVAGGGAGLLQGLAFTPVENLVRFLQQSASSIANIFVKLTHLPLPHIPTGFEGTQPQTPLQAMKNLLSSEAWRKSPSWWTGWRWTVSRDAVSYACFFAAFDMTRRIGLRVKALFGGDIQNGWDNFLVIDFNNDNGNHQGVASSTAMATATATPTIARVAQATTIVVGGITASVLAEFAARPFRVCQKIMTNEKLRIASASNGATTFNLNSGMGKGRYGTFPFSSSNTGIRIGRNPNPIIDTIRNRGITPFFQRPDWKSSVSATEGTSIVDNGTGMKEKMVRMGKKVGWRVASVGPWGLGFLVWAWVGGEV